MENGGSSLRMPALYPRTSRTARLALPALVITVAFALFGCYTILKHPVTDGEGPQRTEAHPQEYYRQNCLDCHADYEEYPYGYFYGVYPDYYWEYPRWGYYYAYPWWWDHHWYDDAPVPEDEGLVEGTKAERRGGIVPPYVQGVPAVNTGGLPPVGTGYSNPGSTNTGGKTPTGGTPGAGSQQGEKTRVRMSGETDSTGTPAGDTTKKETTKAQRRGGTKP